MGVDLRIWLLGGFRVTVDGSPVADGSWRRNKAKAIVELLALPPGHRLHREQLMDVLRPDLAPAAAAGNLRKAVYFARQALAPEHVRVQGEMLRLEAPRLWVDVEAFEAAAAAADVKSAVDLYGGDLLPEDRFESWTEERRDRLRAWFAAGRFPPVAGPPEVAALPAPTTAVDPGMEASEERKLVTVVLLDVMASPTAPDPERTRLELDRCAGLELLERSPMPIRVGVGTGEVITPAGTRAHPREIAGSVLEAAVRLPEEADPATVMADEPTCRAAGAAFEFGEPARLAAGGGLELRARRLVGVTSGASPGQPRLQGPMIGRDAELGVLLSLFDEVVASRQPRLLNAPTCCRWYGS